MVFSRPRRAPRVATSRDAAGILPPIAAANRTKIRMAAQSPSIDARSVRRGTVAIPNPVQRGRGGRVAGEGSRARGDDSTQSRAGSVSFRWAQTASLRRFQALAQLLQSRAGG